MNTPTLAVSSSALIDTQAILRAYRALYRTALKAVHFSTPARHQIRSIIRASFRYEPPSNFSPRRIVNTVKFLERAQEFNDVEHKVLRNLLHVGFWRRDLAGGLDDITTVASGKTHIVKKFVKKKSEGLKAPWLKGSEDTAIELRRDLYSHFDATVVLLNESMDLCLRSIPMVDLANPEPTLSPILTPEKKENHKPPKHRPSRAARQNFLESDKSWRNGHTKQPHRPRERRNAADQQEIQTEEKMRDGPYSKAGAIRRIFR